MRTAVVYNFLLEANLMASIAILLMLPIRRFLRGRLGSRAIYFAWLLVAVRLLCPLTLPNPAINGIRSPFAMDSAIRPIAGQLMVRFQDILSRVEQLMEEHPALPGSAAVAKDMNHLLEGMYNGMLPLTLMKIYLAGAALVLIWFAAANLRFRLRLRAGRIEPISGRLLEQYELLCRQRNVRPIPVYFTDPLPSACLVGDFRPYIALPLSAPPQEAVQVLTHEVCHYKGGDHLWALLRLLCCTVHWFDPLVWAAAYMSRTDGELACDERVIDKLKPRQKLDYAHVLVLAAARRNAPGVAGYRHDHDREKAQEAGEQHPAQWTGAPGCGGRLCAGGFHGAGGRFRHRGAGLCPPCAGDPDGHRRPFRPDGAGGRGGGAALLAAP